MKTARLLTVWLVVSALGTAPVRAGQSSAIDYLPADSLAIVVVRDGDRRVEALRDWVESIDLADSPLMRKLESNPEFMQGKFALMGFMAASGVDPWKAAGGVLGRELAVGIAPGEPGRPRVILAMVSRESALLDRILKSVHTLTGLERDGRPDESRSKEHDGVRVYSLAPNVYHCRVDDALLIANSGDLLRTAIASRSRPDDEARRSPRLTEARQRVPDDAVAWAFVDVRQIRSQVADDAKPDGPRDNPLGGFLLGAWWHAILHGDSAVGWARADATGIRLETRVVASQELPRTHRGFVPEPSRAATWNPADLPRFLAEIQVSRGWADLFSEREALLTTAGASQALQFTSTMSTLFGGMDFLNDVLPRLEAPTQLILARQDFSTTDVKPSPRLPAFALVQPIHSQAAADFAQRLRSATQMALSLLSLDMAQKNQPTYLIDVDRYRDQRIVFSTFSAPPSTTGMTMDAPQHGQPADPPNAADEGMTAPAGRQPDASVRYNFLPAAALVDDRYIVATSRALLQDVIDRILDAKSSAAAASRAAADRLDSFVLDVPSLVNVLRENRDELVINRMLEQNESKARAQTVVDTILAALEYAGVLRISSRIDGREHYAAFELSVRNPAGTRRP